MLQVAHLRGNGNPPLSEDHSMLDLKQTTVANAD
jgi:hypothetical protein